MAEEFSSITLERYSGGTWINLWPDVLKDTGVRGGVGILNNGFLDRVPDGNTLTFSLDNSEWNSQATRGYYSSITNLSLGDIIRVGFHYDGASKYLPHYYIPPNGIKVEGFTNSTQRVNVTANDWFGLMSDYKLDSIPYATNKRLEEAIQLIIDELEVELRPVWKKYSTGDETFADVFDLMKATTTVLGEINKTTISEMGYTYLRANGIDGNTLVVENRLYRRDNASDTVIPVTASETTSMFLLADGSSNFLLADGTSNFLLTDTQTISFGDTDLWTGRQLDYNRGDDYANYSKITITPRVVDAAATSILFTMEGSIKVAASTTLDPIEIQYRDPDNRTSRINCIQGTTPVINTDYKAYANSDGTGTDLTANLNVTVSFETAVARITLRNTGATDLYTGGDILFQLRGKGVKVYDTVDYVLSRSHSATVGRKSLDFNLPYFSRVEDATNILYHVLKDANSWGVSIRRYPLLANRDKKNMMAFMYLDVGARATFAETMSTYNTAAWINGYEFEILNKQRVTWSPCLFRQANVPPF